jgi:iron complex outermembrane receptor protein
VFHAEYEDLQVQASTVVNGLTQFVPTNAGTSTTRGIEIEAAARPTDGLTISGGLTLLDAEIDAPGLNCNLTQVAVVLAPTDPVPGNTCYRFTGQAAGLNRQNVESGALPNAPDFRANLTARYETPLGSTGYEGVVQGSVVHQSDVLFSLEQDPISRQKAYTTVDASAGVRTGDGRYQLTVFVRNLFDQSYATSIFRDAFFGNAASPNNIDHYRPKEAERYVGAALRVNF